MDDMRCAIYARYSSDLQHERSIDDQVRNCRRFADQKGWVVVDGHIYTDRAVSGITTEGRTGLTDLLSSASLQPRPFDCVLVDDTSRLSRKMGEVDTIIERLRYNNVHVCFVSQGIDSRDKQSHLTVGVNSLIDSQYRRDLASKTLRGMAGQVLKGFNAGGRLYGYKYVKVLNETGTIDRKTGQTKVIGSRVEIDPEQVAVVQEIFRLYSEGLGIRDITHHLNEKGYPPPYNKRQLCDGSRRPAWIPGTVRRILGNTRYIGDWTFNNTGWVRNPETGQRRRVSKDCSEWTENEQPQLAIIDQPTWETVQKRMEAARKGPQRKRTGHRSSFLFSGLMKCHVCGRNYVLVTGSDRPNPLFGCGTNWQRGKAACPNSHRVSKSEIEETILSDIQLKLLSPPILSAIVSKVNAKLKTKIAMLKRQSVDIVVERQDHAKKLLNIIAAIENGAMSEALKQRLADHEERIRELDAKVEIVNQTHDFGQLKVDERYVKRWLTRMRELLNTNVMAAKAKLTSLIGGFTLSPETIDGIKYLRVKGAAQVDGLLAVAAGAGNSPITGILGGGIEPPAS